MLRSDMSKKHKEQQDRSGFSHRAAYAIFQEEKAQEIKRVAASKRFWFALLGLSILCEVTATIALKVSAGFTVLAPSIVTIAGYGTSFILLVKILEHMPLGLIYGIWGGVGSALTMLVGVLVWHDAFTPLTALGLGLVVIGVYLLNAATDELEAQRMQKEASKRI